MRENFTNKSIVNIDEIVGNLRDEERKLFTRFYRYYVKTGKLRLTEEMKDWATERFGNCEEQKIVRITNKITLESTLFNELRARRPIEGKMEEEKIEESCKFFCNPLKFTPEDVFGRVFGKHSVTASNIAKYDYLHGLVIFKEHNPFYFDEEKIEDYFYVAMEWFEKARKHNPEGIYPTILWNCMWRAGASIVHGHMQLLLSHEPYGKYEFYERIHQNYRKDYNGDYFIDMAKIHRFLGLSIKYKNSTLMAYITPIKEKEIFAISESFDTIPKIVFKILNFYKKINVRSFNVVVFPPPFNGEKELPYIVRVVDRGLLNTKTSDIGGMELYAGTSVVSTDPFKLAEKLKNEFI